MVRCSVCEAQARPGAAFCAGCGAGLVETAVEDAQTLPPPTGQQPLLSDPEPLAVAAAGAPASPAPSLAPTSPLPAPADAAVAGPPGVAGPPPPPTGRHDPRAEGPEARRGRALPLALLGFAIVATVGVAYWLLTGGAGVSGGSASPDQLVTDVVAALESRDPVAALALVHPDEGQGLAEVYPALLERLEGHGLLEGLPFDGTSLTLSDVGTRVRELGPGAARIELRDVTAGATVDPSAVDPGFRFLAGEGDWEGELPRGFEGWDRFTGTSVPMDWFVVAVEVEGRWFVSPVATAMQYAVELYDLSPPEFGAPISSDRAATEPDAAIMDLVEAVGDGDARDVLAGVSLADGTLGAYEEALQDLLDLVVPGGEGALGNRATWIGAEVDHLELVTEDLPDGRLLATVDSAELVLDGEDVEWDGDCLHDASGPACVDAEFWELTGLGGLFVVMEPQGEGWVVDPVATLIEYVERLIAGADAGAALRLLDLDALSPTRVPLTLAAGVDEVTLNGAGVAVAEFDAQAGDRIAITLDDPELLEVVVVHGPDGVVWQEWWPRHLTVVDLETAGHHRVVIRSRDWAPDEVTFGISRVAEPSEVDAADGPIEVELAAGEVRAFEVSPSGRGFFFDGDVVYRGDCGPFGPCTEPATVYLGGTAADTYRAGIDLMPEYGFGAGQTTVTGNTTGSFEDTFEALVPAESTVELVLVPDADFDAILDVVSSSGQTYHSDWGFDGDTESVTGWTGTNEEVWTITVRGWRGDAGGFRLELHLP